MIKNINNIKSCDTASSPAILQLILLISSSPGGKQFCLQTDYKGFKPVRSFPSRSTIAQKFSEGCIFLILDKPNSRRLLISSGHVPSKCHQILPFRTVLAVIVGLPDAFHIGSILATMQGRLQPLQGFRQSLTMVLPDPALPEKSRSSSPCRFPALLLSLRFCGRSDRRCALLFCAWA